MEQVRNTMVRMAKRFSLALLATATLVGFAAADDGVPQLVGTWKGVSLGGARYGAITHGKSLEVPTFSDTTQQWTLVIEKQQGRGVIGSWSGSAKVEKMLGAIRADNKTVIFSDEDTIHNAVLLSDTKMELCHQEAREDEIIAQCAELEKQ